MRQATFIIDQHLNKPYEWLRSTYTGYCEDDGRNELGVLLAFEVLYSISAWSLGT